MLLWELVDWDIKLPRDHILRMEEEVDKQHCMLVTKFTQHKEELVEGLVHRKIQMVVLLVELDKDPQCLETLMEELDKNC